MFVDSSTRKSTKCSSTLFSVHTSVIWAVCLDDVSILLLKNLHRQQQACKRSIVRWLMKEKNQKHLADESAAHETWDLSAFSSGISAHWFHNKRRITTHYTSDIWSVPQLFTIIGEKTEAKPSLTIKHCTKNITSVRFENNSEISVHRFHRIKQCQYNILWWIEPFTSHK